MKKPVGLLLSFAGQAFFNSSRGAMRLHFSSSGPSSPTETSDALTATTDLAKEQMDKSLLEIGLLPEPTDKEKCNFIVY